jgi:hypothetical protein
MTLTEDKIDRPSIPGVQATLRDLDWRFLLPQPANGQFEHLVLLGGPRDLADRVIELGLARRVSRQLLAERKADALVILHDAAVSLAAAIHSLQPGGVLYYEAERQLSNFVDFSLDRLRRRLAQSDLTMTGIYWIRPDFVRSQLYMPLDLPQVLPWYTNAMFVATTPTRRLLEPFTRAISWLQANSPFSLVRCYAVTAKLGLASSQSSTGASMLGDPLFPSELRQPNVRPLLLTAGHDEWNRVIVLPFSDRSPRPLSVLKFSRLPERNAHTENEQRVLAKIRASLDARMARTIPEPLGLLCWRSLAVSIESCVPGRLFSAATGRWGMPLRQKIDYLHLAADWLTRFHRQTQLDQLVWNQETNQQWVEEALTAYADLFDLTVDEEALFAAVRQRSQELIGASLPMIWEHYAFDDQNLYRDGDEIYVIDWEGSGAGLPLFDLLYFLVRWSDRMHGWDGAASLRGFARLFCEPDPKDPVRTAVDQAIAVYLEGMGIDVRFFPLLLVLMWVKRSLSRAERQSTLGTHGVGLRSDNVYVEYVVRLADCTGLLFDERGRKK